MYSFMYVIIHLCRCDIPVVIMGETGCGKTRLIRYMCQLQAKFRTDLKDTPRQTFFILKVMVLLPNVVNACLYKAI